MKIRKKSNTKKPRKNVFDLLGVFNLIIIAAIIALLVLIAGNWIVFGYIGLVVFLIIFELIMIYEIGFMALYKHKNVKYGETHNMTREQVLGEKYTTTQKFYIFFIFTFSAIAFVIMLAVIFNKIELAFLAISIVLFLIVILLIWRVVKISKRKRHLMEYQV